MPTLAAVTAVNDAADLKGKTALVVGGTSGCGKGVALVLARRGCAVTVVGRNEARDHTVGHIRHRRRRLDVHVHHEHLLSLPF